MQLFYFVSPMCSWCWGFSPVIHQVQENFSTTLPLQVVLTPFRIDNDKAMDKKLRDYVLDQWHKVHAKTGQEFDFNFSVKDNFIYNTLLACKAIKAFALQCPNDEPLFIFEMQKAFYTQNLDITDETKLVEIASYFKVNLNKFTHDIHSEKIAQTLKQDFSMCQQFGVNSYPTLLLQKQTKMMIIANGYSPYSAVEIELSKNVEK